jgi:uncharacterized protein YhfF
VNALLEQYWSDFECWSQDHSSTKPHLYEAFRFGNTETSARELAALVVSGLKTTTSDLLWTVELNQKPLVQMGDFSIVTDWDEKPVCLIQTTEVRVLPLEQIDAQFAFDYGEGDRTLEWWKREMWRYYVHECKRIGRKATRDMPLVCERFRVVHI